MPVRDGTKGPPSPSNQPSAETTYRTNCTSRPITFYSPRFRSIRSDARVSSSIAIFSSVNPPRKRPSVSQVYSFARFSRQICPIVTNRLLASISGLLVFWNEGS